MPPQPEPAHVPQHSRAIVPPPPPPPPRAPVSNSSVGRLPPPPAPPPRFYQQPRPPLSRARHLPLSSFSRRPAPHRPNEMLTNTCCSCGNPAPHQCVNSRCWACCSSDDCPCHASGALGLPSGAPPPPPPPPPHQPGMARLASVML